MPIWIANTTRQEFELQVRLPEMGRIYTVKISSGKQAEVKDLTPSQEEYMLQHLVRFGAVKRQDMHGKAKEFTGIAYSLDKPFKMDEFHYGLEDVLDHAENRAVDQAVKSALAADVHMRDKSTGDRMSLSTEVEMVEEKPENAKRQKRMKITVDPKVSNQTVPLQ
ncbi:MAG: hypothetical protein KGL39_46920 [Patescibacteria group bacterium]|nr:hypothetical protein [Patescibacteria group bacterium]